MPLLKPERLPSPFLSDETVPLLQELVSQQREIIALLQRIAHDMPRRKDKKDHR